MSAFRPKPDIATRSSERPLCAKSGHQLPHNYGSSNQ